MATYTWEQVSEITGLSMDDLDALSGQLDHDGTDVTEDGLITETGLAVLRAQARWNLVDALGAAYEQHRAKAEDVRDRLRAATVALVEAGASEYEAAARARVTRMTVRAWLGKRP